MGSSRNALFGAGLLGLAACSTGSGEGWVSAVVTDPECGLDAAVYSLRPTFFGGEALPVDDQLELRVQRGGNLEGASDGVRVLVYDAAAVKGSLLGTPIALDGTSPLVRISLYLNETCPLDFTTEPTNLESRAGEIVFDAIYAPAVDDRDLETNAWFDGIELADPRRPGDRHATLSGAFRFLYNRGRPAQRFP